MMLFSCIFNILQGEFAICLLKYKKIWILCANTNERRSYVKICKSISILHFLTVIFSTNFSFRLEKLQNQQRSY